MSRQRGTSQIHMGIFIRLSTRVRRIFAAGLQRGGYVSVPRCIMRMYPKEEKKMNKGKRGDSCVFVRPQIRTNPFLTQNLCQR